MYAAPVPLDAGHDLAAFACRSDEQTDWLRNHARQSSNAGSTRVFVVTEVDESRVVAYYAWCMAQIALDAAPARMRRGVGRYPQPVALLARLGVDRGHEAAGLGSALLADVFARCVALSDRIGVRALLLHCESEAARAFYLHVVPEFEASPTDPFHLLLLTKDIRRTLAR